MTKYFFDHFPYLTQEKKLSFWAKNFTNLSFYSRMVSIVVRAGIKAKKKQYPGSEWVKSSEEVAQLFEDIGAKFQIEGFDEFRHSQKARIFIANHMSTLETFILPAIIQPYCDVTFVVKQSLIDYPFFGAVLQAREPIVLGRKNPREDLSKVLEEGQAILASGRSIIIFPQSTRAEKFDAKQFTSIGIKLAKKANVPVVPIALKTDTWSTGRFIKDFGKIYPERLIHFDFAKELLVDGAGKEEHQLITDFIANKLNIWQSEK